MDNYEKLRQLLDKSAVGAPASKSFYEILKILFTQEEVEIALFLTFKLSDVDTIAQKTGVEKDKIFELCESMADKGIIFSSSKNGIFRYALSPTIPGLFEFPLMKGAKDETKKRLGKLWMEYHHESQLKEFTSSKTPFARILPLEQTVAPGNETLPYEIISKMMGLNRTFSVAECACRVASGEDACDKPKNVCLMFDSTAEFLIERKIAKKITREEALEIVLKSEKEGLVHTTNNSKDRLTFICNCCPCCCTVLVGQTKLNSKNPFAKSSWIASVNKDACTGCGICKTERCPVEAILVYDEKADVNDSLCIGCGLCSSTCPEDAISMISRSNYEKTPETAGEMMQNIMKEKGKLKDYTDFNKS